jgi:hypothetical protein
MSLPGFTAEASIYGKSEHYRGMRSASLTGGNEVVPQFCYVRGGYRCCCTYFGCTCRPLL